MSKEFDENSIPSDYLPPCLGLIFFYNFFDRFIKTTGTSFARKEERVDGLTNTFLVLKNRLELMRNMYNGRTLCFSKRDRKFIFSHLKNDGKAWLYEKLRDFVDAHEIESICKKIHNIFVDNIASAKDRHDKRSRRMNCCNNSLYKHSIVRVLNILDGKKRDRRSSDPSGLYPHLIPYIYLPEKCPFDGASCKQGLKKAVTAYNKTCEEKKKKKIETKLIGTPKVCEIKVS